MKDKMILNIILFMIFLIILLNGYSDIDSNHIIDINKKIILSKMKRKKYCFPSLSSLLLFSG